MTNSLYNLARMTTTTTGTGTVSLLSAVSGYLSFEDAGVQDADVVTYAIHEGSNSEVGQGTYTSSGATLSRDVVYASTNNGAQITLSGNAQVFITASAEDFASLVDASGTPVDSQIAVWTDANTIEGASSLTYDGTSLKANGTLLLQEAAAAAADQPGYGQIWVKNDSPSTLWYTDDAGTDYEIGTGAGGTVDVSGTPVNDQIAIWTDADTLEGQTALTFTSGVLQVGSGDSGATINAGADNFQIKTSSTADIGMTISDGGTTSEHRIDMRTSDDDVGFIVTEHDPAQEYYGIRTGYDDGSNAMFMLIDFDEDQFDFRCQGALAATLDANADDFVFNHGLSDGGATILHANGGTSRLYFGSPSDVDAFGIVASEASSRMSFVIESNSTYRFETAGFKQLEASAANSDDAGFGQWWTRNTTPNVPYFTDDAGTDHKLLHWTVASGSPGTLNTFTGFQFGSIPDWVNEIVISIVGASTNGTSPWIIRLGDSGGLENTGYTSRCRGNTTATSDTTGFIITTANHAAADTLYGEVRLSRVDNGLGWTYSSHCVGNSNVFIGAGYKATSATLDRIQLTTTGGANTFDAGTMSVKYS